MLPWLLLLPWLFPLLAATLFPTGRSKIVIVVEDDPAPLIDVLKIGIGRLASPVAPVIDEVPLNGAKMSRLNGA